MLPAGMTVQFAGKEWGVGFMGFVGEDFYYALCDKKGAVRLIPAMAINWEEEKTV